MQYRGKLPAPDTYKTEEASVTHIVTLIYNLCLSAGCMALNPSVFKKG